MGYEHIYKLYNKLHSKYCFSCSSCRSHKIKLIYFGHTPLSNEDAIKYHAEFCCKEKEDLKKKVEEEIKYIEEEKEKRKKNKRIYKKELREIKIKKSLFKTSCKIF